MLIWMQSIRIRRDQSHARLRCRRGRRPCGAVRRVICSAERRSPGRAVRVFIGSRRTRADSRVEEGFCFNYGPHALYRGGSLDTALRDQGVVPAGKVPNLAAGYFVRDRTLHLAPFSASGLAETTLYPSALKAEVGAALARFGKSAPEVGQGVTARQAMEEFSQSPHVRELISAMLRLTSYIHDPDAADGATLFAQLHRALSNNVVTWTMAGTNWSRHWRPVPMPPMSAGVGQRVTAIEPGQTWRVETGSGNSVSAPAVVIAVPPRDALELLPYAEALRVAADRSAAVYAACLDLGLSQLPEPRHIFALGLDQPLYLSVHSSAARLAPGGGALVHILRYLQPDRSSTRRCYLRNSRASLTSSNRGGAHMFAPVNSSGRCRLCAQSRWPDFGVSPAGRG